MIVRINNSASFEDAMQDAISAVENNGANTNQDTIALYFEMNGNYSPNGSACVNSRVYINETIPVVTNDLANND